jgi:hypothetical protein
VAGEQAGEGSGAAAEIKDAARAELIDHVRVMPRERMSGHYRCLLRIEQAASASG